jgi:thioesterase domain-containing protein
MLFRNPTIRSLAAELHIGGRENQSRTVLQLGDGAGQALFCICGVHAYQELADQLAPEIPAYGIFLPVEQEMFARGGSDGAGITVADMAAGYLEAIREQQTVGPYLLLGFCFGGILAYEIARQLVDAGEQVGVVFMLDSKLRSATKTPRIRTRLRNAKQAAIRTAAPVVDRIEDRLGRGARDEPGEIERLELIRLQAYRAALRQYEVGPYGGQAVLVRPMSTRSKHLADPTYGWGPHAAQLEILDIPGDHHSHLKRPNVQILAQTLRPYLERSRNLTQSETVA